jgi:hypothetical protein
VSALTAATAVLNIILGLVYTSYGTMTAVEMVRDRRRLGFSHFGAAWIAMAFTCGPHHWVHGIHLGLEGRTAGVLDLVAVLVGVPAGVTWFVLRVEAFRGGRGDRFISGTPHWLMALPTLGGVYVTAVVAAAIGVGVATPEELAVVIPNLLLVVLYSAIGYYLIRTQLANRRSLGGWSVSGLALSIVFPTCAAMHAVYAFYALTGTYGLDWHGVTIDWIAVPAAVYFLWVVQALYRGTFRDWNGAPGMVPASQVVAATAPSAHAPAAW